MLTLKKQDTDCNNDDYNSSELNDPDLNSNNEDSESTHKGISREVLVLGAAFIKMKKLNRTSKLSSKSRNLFEANYKTHNLSPFITKYMNV